MNDQKDEIILMAPRRTVQNLFGLKPEELNALTVLSGLEGFRGGKNSPDVAAVASNALARRLSGQWGGKDIRNIAKAPGQYVAVDRYSMQQLSDPAFGAKVFGSEAEFNRLRDIVNNPDLVGQQFNKSKGAQSFRGVSAYGNKKPGDYMPVPGQSNFYFNGLQGDLYNKGASLFSQAGEPVPGLTPPPPVPGAQVGDRRSVEEILGSALGLASKPGLDAVNQQASSLLGDMKSALIKSLIPSIINPMRF